MRDLVGDDRCMAAPAEHRSGCFIQQQSGVAIEDGRSVLHPAPLIIGDGEHIQLSKGIPDAIPLVVKLNGMRSNIQCKLGLVFAFGHGANTDGHGIDLPFQALPIANCKGHQVGRHFR